MVTLFLTFDAAPVRMPAFESALVYTPDRADDPFLDDGAPPRLVLQAYFPSLDELQFAVSGKEDFSCRAEAMTVRAYGVPDGRIGAEPYCTYLVAYEGPAEDEAAWHAHYLAHHPPIMARLPGIRQLEIYLPLEWRCPAAWRRVRHLQRNKVAFDSPATLTAALNSPVRKEMRADYARLPRFSGAVKHYPMATRRLLT